MCNLFICVFIHCSTVPRTLLARCSWLHEMVRVKAPWDSLRSLLCTISVNVDDSLRKEKTRLLSFCREAVCLSLILRGRARLCDFIKTQLKKAKKSHSCLLYLVNETVTTSVLVFDDTHMGFCLFCACNPLFYNVGLVQYCWRQILGSSKFRELILIKSDPPSFLNYSNMH